MGKVIKWLLKAVISLLVIIVLAVGYLLVAVDPNDLKPEIKTAAANQGLELSLNGNLSWQFLPQIGVVAEKVEFVFPSAHRPRYSRGLSWI